jgi:hypothetical protein
LRLNGAARRRPFLRGSGARAVQKVYQYTTAFSSTALFFFFFFEFLVDTVVGLCEPFEKKRRPLNITTVPAALKFLI